MRPDRVRRAGWLGLLLVSLLAFVGLTAELTSADAGGRPRLSAVYDEPARATLSAGWDLPDHVLPSAAARPGPSTAAPEPWGIADPLAVADRSLVLDRSPRASGLVHSANGVSPNSCRAPPAT